MENTTKNVTTHLIKEIQKVSFSWYDYTLFSFMLGVSTLIGIYFGCFGKKQSTANEYLLGGKSMTVFPIAMSLVASQVSGITMLAIPADIYIYGVTFWLSSFSAIIAAILNCYLYFPVFHKIQVTSTYEYLKLRFDKRVQMLSSFIFATSFVYYLPIVVYIPALAFSQATGVHVHLVTPIVCSVCIFYTTIGGLKAVVWTDTIQFVAMIGGIVAVTYVGIHSAGGLVSIWETSKAGGRLDIDFDTSITKRDTFWAAIFGLSFNWISFIAIHQGSVQKFISLGSLSKAKRAMLYFCAGMVLIKGSSTLIGLIIYSKYHDCDPLSTKQITANDQLLPYFIMDVAGDIPGLPGLFIAGIFCAALSTLSASMNCLAGTIYEDFVSPCVSKNLTQKAVSNILKLIVVVIGVFSTAMVFIVENLGGLLPLAISFGGITHGPLVGVFSLGMFIPWATSTGAFCGGVASVVFNTWMIIGAQLYKVKKLIVYPKLPTSVDNCDFFFNETITQINSISEDSEPFFLYRITFYYYTLIGVLVVFIVGLPVSWFTKKSTDKVDQDLISPAFQWLIPKEKKIDYYSIDKGLNVTAVHDDDTLKSNM